MTQDIRIYFFQSAPGSPLEVSAFRDICTAVQKWNDDRQSAVAFAGFLFAGSSRPSIAEVGRLLKSWRGFMLVSESCRWLLPKSMDVFGSSVEGIQEGTDYHEMSVYLGSRGWGYEESYAKSRLLRVRPEDIGMQESIRRERLVEPDGLGAQDEIARLLAIVGNTDPFLISKHLPEWALSVPLARLPLTVRCNNVLSNQGLVSLRDLGRYSRDEALGWKNFGRQSIIDLADAMVTYLRMIPNNVSGALYMTEEVQLSPLLECVRSSLVSMEKRDRAIWKGRLGLDGPRRTLEELAQAFGVTRERIRQIEVGILKTYARSNVWALTISSRIDILLRGREEPLYVDLIEVEEPWFAGMDIQSELLKGLLYYFSPSHLQVCEVQGRAIVSTLDSKSWLAHKRSAIALLKTYQEQSLTKSEAETIIRSSIAGVAPELGGLLVSEVMPYLHYRGEGDEEKLVSVGLGLTATIRAILEDSDAPIHFGDVAASAQELLGKPVSSAHVNSTLDRIGALYFGRGTYGLWKRCPLSPKRRDEILSVAEVVAENELGQRQWHIDELLERMTVRSPEMCSMLDKYTLNLILATSLKVVPLGRMVWISSSCLSDLPKERIEIQDSCIRLLREAGHPLNYEELKAALSPTRGMSAYFMLNPDGEMARVAPGTWGLVSRDFHSTQEQRTQILDKLYAYLVETGECVHLDRLIVTVFHEAPLPLGVTPFMVMGLTQTDPRLHVYRGRLIGLKAWEIAEALVVEENEMDAEELCESGSELYQ